ncbi:MAG: amidohydrolase family protein [Caulobacteraceae bacterium]
MIDAHQHFWRIGRNDCRWPTPDLAAIYRDYAPKALIDLAAPLGVRGSVLVQSQPSDRDTDYLLDLAEGEPFVLGVVGWVFVAAANAPARIAALSARAKFRGLRPMLQDLERDDWILGRELEPAIAAVMAHNLTFDALATPRHLQPLLVFAERHPGLPIAVDHGGKPDIAGGGLDPWRDAMSALAALPQVFCKLSGLLTQAGPEQGEEAVRPYIEHLLQAFGPERLMWGSDWPVVDLCSQYSAWLRIVSDVLQGLHHDAAAHVFSLTAQRFYRL